MGILKLKSLIFTITFFSLFAILESANAQQIYKFRAKYFCSKNYEYKYGGWSDWSDWKETNLLIVIDLDDERIKIYLDEPQYLDIYDHYLYKDGDKSIISFSVIDNGGIRCRARFVYYEYDDDRQLYIDYSDFTVAYSIKPLSKY